MRRGKKRSRVPDHDRVGQYYIKIRMAKNVLQNAMNRKCELDTMQKKYYQMIEEHAALRKTLIQTLENKATTLEGCRDVLALSQELVARREVIETKHKDLNDQWRSVEHIIHAQQDIIREYETKLDNLF